MKISKREKDLAYLASLDLREINRADIEIVNVSKHGRIFYDISMTINGINIDFPHMMNKEIIKDRAALVSVLANRAADDLTYLRDDRS